MLQQQWPRIFRQIRVGYNFCQNHYYSSEINSVPLTTDRYPNVKRGDFAILQESDVKFFESIIGANRILTQEDELNGINISRHRTTNFPNSESPIFTTKFRLPYFFLNQK